jgi:hypothetical protein
VTGNGTENISKAYYMAMEAEANGLEFDYSSLFLK